MFAQSLHLPKVLILRKVIHASFFLRKASSIMLYMDAQNTGRPPTDTKKLEDVKRRLKKGEKPSDIERKTGVSLTKVYELRRLLKESGEL